jgi:type II secretory pathway predicted ATPase ExeA
VPNERKTFYWNPDTLNAIMKEYKIKSISIAKGVNVHKKKIGDMKNYLFSGLTNFDLIIKVKDFLVKSGVPEKEAKQILTPQFENKRTHESKTKNNKEITPMLDYRVLDHFNLSRHPFLAGRILIKDLYVNNVFKKLSQSLIDAALNDRFLLATGPTGTGKSTILNNVVHALKREKKLQLIIPNTLDVESIDQQYLLKEIISALSNEGVPREKRDRIQTLQVVLERQKKLKKRVCIIIDEAHRLSLKTLRALKQFWEGLGVHYSNMSILLIAQDAIDGLLEKTVAKEISDRLEHLTLNPFHSGDTIHTDTIQQYISHKLNRAGCDKEIFKPDAIKALAERVETPQELNNLAIKSLNLAVKLGENYVTRDIVDEA